MQQERLLRRRGGAGWFCGNHSDMIAAYSGSEAAIRSAPAVVRHTVWNAASADAAN
jgi:hypothetical protein